MRRKSEPMKLDARRVLILQAMARGETYNQMINHFSKEWDLSIATTKGFIKDTLRYMRSEETKETLVAMNMERLDNIISDSIKEKDRKNAIKAIDTQNKLAGGYEDKVKIESDDEVKLIFKVD